MSIFSRMLPACLLSLLILAPIATEASSRTLSERVRALENTHANPELMEQLLSRIDALQNEVQELRGTIEQQGYEIEGLKRRQRDQYLDIDRRLQQAGLSASHSARTTVGSTARKTPLRSENARVPASTRRMTGSENQPPQVRATPPRTSTVHGLGENKGVPPEVIADPVAERAAYDLAFSKLKNGQYADAAKLFREFLNRYPNGEFADNAQYWLGEAFYVTRNYQVALEAFETLLKRYPNSPKVPDTEIKLGFTQYELKHWEESRRYLEEVVSRYPNTTVARLAEGRLRALRLEGH